MEKKDTEYLTKRMMNIFGGLGYYEPSVDDRDLTTVIELTALTNNGHASKGCMIEVEVGLVGGVPGTLIRDNNHHGSPQTYG